MRSTASGAAAARRVSQYHTKSAKKCQEVRRSKNNDARLKPGKEYDRSESPSSWGLSAAPTPPRARLVVPPDPYLKACGTTGPTGGD